MDACRIVHYSGSVQGVGFRFTARGLAKRYSVTGYVRNLDDGRVEVVAAGEKEEVTEYLAALRKSMGEYIASEEGTWTTCPEHFVTFDVRF
jgi:acylphosphatase